MTPVFFEDGYFYVFFYLAEEKPAMQLGQEGHLCVNFKPFLLENYPRGGGFLFCEIVNFLVDNGG